MNPKPFRAALKELRRDLAEQGRAIRESTSIEAIEATDLYQSAQYAANVISNHLMLHRLSAPTASGTDRQDF